MQRYAATNNRGALAIANMGVRESPLRALRAHCSTPRFVAAGLGAPGTCDATGNPASVMADGASLTRDPIGTLDATPDLSRFVPGSADGVVRVHDGRTRSARAEFTHEGGLGASARSRDGRWLLPPAPDGSVHLRDLDGAR